MREELVKRLRQDEHDGVLVSTIWLAMDHSFGYGEPIHWETMVFGGEMDGYQERYTSEEEALAGHERIREQAHVGLDMATRM